MSLKQTIRTLGIKQRDLARVVDVTEGTVSQWCSEMRRVPPHHARKLHDALGIPLHVMNPEVWPAEQSA